MSAYGLMTAGAFTAIGFAIGCLAWAYELKVQLRAEMARNARLHDELSDFRYPSRAVRRES